MPASTANKGPGIKTPHDHDVLSGRGNFVNYHPGNEFFRSLVRKYKMDYVKCPKPQKGKYSKLIYDDIQARNPPGRFLKQDNKTKEWHDIGEKKALDKARQALREGAPELMKELSGESGEDSDSEEEVIARKKQPAKKSDAKKNNAGGVTSAAIPTDNMQAFLSSPGALSRNGMMSIGSIGTIGLSPMMSPGMLSPGMGMLMTPDGMQFSAQQQMGNSMSGRLQSPLSEMIPPPQVHPVPSNVESINNMMSPQHQQRFLQQQQIQQQQQQLSQMTPQQQQQFMMNMNAMNAMGNGGIGGTGGDNNNMDNMMSLQQQQQQFQQQQMRINQMRHQMMNNQLQMQQQMEQQQIQMQQQVQPQQMHMNQLRQQQQQLQQQRQQSQSKLQEQQQFVQNMQEQQPQTPAEMQMLQNKLAAIYATDALDPRPIADSALSSSNHRKPDASNVDADAKADDKSNEEGALDSTVHTGNAGRGNTTRVETLPGNNPRRMPPPSLLKRDDSLKMDKIFEPTSPGGEDTKKKYGDGSNADSAHLSAMSLSMGDLNDAGDLSQVFDSSLKISGGNSKNSSSNLKTKVGGSASSATNRNSSKALPAGHWGAGESKSGDRSPNNTSWENAHFDMSVATIGASDIAASEVGNMSYATLNMPDHEGHMSFTSHVFEESEQK